MTPPTAVTTSELVRLARAARRLALTGALFDPSDDEILVAAAELSEVEVDLETLDHNQRRAVARAYDESAGTGFPSHSHFNAQNGDPYPAEAGRHTNHGYVERKENA